jgi:coenzyme Q-binding protein COQ10
MTNYATTYDVEHSADDMLALAADIASYPEFVPLCSGMEIVSRGNEGDTEWIEARMSVAAGPFHETFTCRVVVDLKRYNIGVRASDGPFKKLSNDWSFEPLSQKSCRVRFSLDYEFSSLALRFALGSVSESAFGRYAEAFQDRADKLYGATPSQPETESGSPTA